MVKLKTLTLKNFKGYTDAHFDFEDKPLALFFGPNGIGKTTILEAVSLTSNPRIFDGRAKDSKLYLRSLIHDENYSPVADMVLEKAKNPMHIQAVFDVDGSTRNVVVSNEGFDVNELPPRHGANAFYADADNASNWSKFQLTEVEAKPFVELAEAIFGYKCDLDGEVRDMFLNEHLGDTVEHLFYQDFILHKGSHKVHFAQMSAGEKKLATLLRLLCNPDNTKDRDIILIDEIDRGVYFKRHITTIEVIESKFIGKQIIATTHSGEIICHFLNGRKECLFDLEKIKI